MLKTIFLPWLVIKALRNDLTLAERDRDGLRATLERQRQLIANQQTMIDHLAKTISNDANGNVKRGARGRFVSAKA